jgi:hypothetical protein
MAIWLETTLKDLHDAAADAFPQTNMRQHATDPIRIEGLRWIPFRGMGTLFVKALVNNEGSKNESIILFKGVKYREGSGLGSVPVVASNGTKVNIDRLSFSRTDALVRCTCGDFRWRFSHWNREDGSLYGRGGRKYEAKFRPGSSNPEESPGMCKHLMKMAKILLESGVLAFGPNSN